jgi:soluble lytic murein transglycosylase-like protein
VRARDILLTLSLLACAAPVRAELVFFATGRSMNVTSHRVEGDSIVLILRGGGEVVCDRRVIIRIEADEVAYPEAVDPGVTLQRDEEGLKAARKDTFNEIIDRVASREGVDPRLVHAVIEVESGYRPNARSRKGAMGLMQLMPATARRYALADPYDPAANIEAGIKHLKSLLVRFPLALAVAAYNAGDAAVQRFGGIPPYAETRNYVSRILQLAAGL